jgi:thiol-disulfide isomerase/thioredoxin
MKYVLISLFIVLLSQSLVAAQDPWREIGIERIDGVAAPGFTLKDIRGDDISLEDFKGRTVFLNFWATWCSPCRAEMPAMEKLHRSFKDRGLMVVAVNYLEDGDRVLKYIRKMSYTFTVLMDNDGYVSGKYRVNAIPVTFLIDRDGRIVGRARGMRDWDSRAAFRFMEELISVHPETRSDTDEVD